MDLVQSLAVRLIAVVRGLAAKHNGTRGKLHGSTAVPVRPRLYLRPARSVERVLISEAPEKP